MPSAYAQLAQKIGLSDAEIDAWSVAADAMCLPYDERLGIVAQDDTFLDKPVWDFFGTPDDQYPLLMHYHPLTLFRHQVCKQADAVLALVLAGEHLDRATKRRSFDYYETVTVHDSTLSASTFAVLAAEVGLVDKAENYFRGTLRVDLDDLHGNTSHGAHMAAMAGSWHALAWGFGGLRVLADASGRAQLKFDPVLPSSWSGYRFGVVWQGRRIDVAVDANGANYTLRGEPLQIAARVGNADARCAHGAIAAAERRVRTRTRSAFPRPRAGADLRSRRRHRRHRARCTLAAWRRLVRRTRSGLGRTQRRAPERRGSRGLARTSCSARRRTKYTSEQKHVLAERKNGYYRASIASMSANDLLPGAREALHAARAAGLKIALASASRSAKEVVESLGVAALFDVIVDAALVAHPKPDPEIFQRAAAALGVHPATCLGIEDAQAGIAAIKSAGMAALGVGDENVLVGADAVIPNLHAFRPEQVRFKRTCQLERQAAGHRRKRQGSNARQLKLQVSIHRPEEGEGNEIQQIGASRADRGDSGGVAANGVGRRRCRAIRRRMRRNPDTSTATNKEQAAAQSNTQSLEGIVVTGSATGVKKIDASYTVTAANLEQIRQANPKSTADILKISPGIWPESSGGQTGANIEIAGFPGGGDAPFFTNMVQGSPLYGMSSLSFMDSSSLLRLDDTIERVEIVQTGPGVLYGAGQMGATANFILRQGSAEPSGSIGLTYGDEGMYRVDGFYGFKIADGWYGSVGGFWRESDGVRDPQFKSDSGGQLTATLTHDFDNGSFMLWGRKLDDKNQFIVPTPFIEDANGNFSKFPGFNGLTDSYGSKAIQHVTIVNPAGGTEKAQSRRRPRRQPELLRRQLRCRFQRLAGFRQVPLRHRRSRTRMRCSPDRIRNRWVISSTVAVSPAARHRASAMRATSRSTPTTCRPTPSGDLYAPGRSIRPSRISTRA